MFPNDIRSLIDDRLIIVIHFFCSVICSNFSIIFKIVVIYNTVSLSFIWISFLDQKVNIRYNNISISPILAVKKVKIRKSLK